MILRDGLGSSEKKKFSCPFRDSNPGPSSPYPSHYIDYTEYKMTETVVAQFDVLSTRQAA